MSFLVHWFQRVQVHRCFRVVAIPHQLIHNVAEGFVGACFELHVQRTAQVLDDVVRQNAKKASVSVVALIEPCGELDAQPLQRRNLRPYVCHGLSPFDILDHLDNAHHNVGELLLVVENKRHNSAPDLCSFAKVLISALIESSFLPLLKKNAGETMQILV